MYDEDQQAEAGGETPASSRSSKAAGSAKRPATKQSAKKKVGAKDAGKEDDRPKRVQYEPDREPPLSGGTSQILTR